MAGSRQTRMIEHSHDRGMIRIPLVEVNGAKDGPTFAVIAGVHSEYAGITAAMNLGQMDPGQLRGRLRVVTIANLPGYLNRTMKVCPVDGQNLARCFPGDMSGDYTDVLAALLFEQVMKGADYLIDAHGGDIEEQLFPYTAWPLTGDAATDQVSERMAHLADFPLIETRVIKHPFDRGRVWDTAATLLKVPSVLLEAGSHGENDPELVAMQYNAMTNIMKEFDMIDGEAVINRKPGYLSHFAGVYAPEDCAFFPAVKAGDVVARGGHLGHLRDLFGEDIGPVTSPADAVILGVVTTTAIPKGAMLIGYGELDDPFFR